MLAEHMTGYIDNCVLPCLGQTPSCQLGAVGLADGWGSHSDVNFLEHCHDKHIHLVMRFPHSTQDTQGEDKSNFAVLKPKYKNVKVKRMSDNYIAGKPSQLGAKDLGPCLHDPWMAAFDETVNKEGWKKTGFSPFTRSVYWDKKKQEEAKARLLPVGDVDFSTLRQGIRQRDMHSTVLDDDEEDFDAEDHAESLKTTRISSSDLCFLSGGVTGEAARQIVKRKQQHKEEQDAERAAKRQRKETDAQEKTKGALEQGAKVVAKVKGSSYFPDLNRADILAALQFKSATPVERGDGKKGPGLKAELLVQLKGILEKDGEMPTPAPHPAPMGTSAPAPPAPAPQTPADPVATAQGQGVVAMDMS